MAGSRVLLQFLVEEGSVRKERIQKRQLALRTAPKAHRAALVQKRYDRKRHQRVQRVHPAVLIPVQKRLHQKRHLRVPHRVRRKRLRSVDLKFVLRFSVFLKFTDEFKDIHKIEKIVNLNIPLNVHVFLSM